MEQHRLHQVDEQAVDESFIPGPSGSNTRAATLKVPQRAERVQPGGTTALHHLIVPLHITSDEDDFCTKALPRVFEKLHSVGSASSLF